MSETLLEMTKALVLAQIEVQYVTPDNLRTVLHSTYEALHRLQGMEAEGADLGLTGRGLELSVPSWKNSITKHAIKCLECGDSFKQLSRRHLQKHDLDSRSYRLKYGIPLQQPLSARAATARRRQVAKSIRPWEKAREARLAPKRSSRTARSQSKSTSG